MIHSNFNFMEAKKTMSKKRYDHQKIEKKWQKIWNETKAFKAEIVPNKPKYYILDMFPYPSGAGLHVGHVTGYTATDILARYKRQKGFNVLHPMGWDSFGLPAEQYAIRTGTHPKITTQKNIDTYKRQLKSLGFSYDWDREIKTSDSSYYKWTQWIFTKLFEKGLAYEADVLVNYCPALGTVLANEEVEEGKSKEGGHLVERRPLKQWILKITDYAEKLLDDLEDLDWPDYLKRLQRNWIGRSEGAKIHFPIDNHYEQISVFTTRADTTFGVTYLVLSPEHPLVNKLTTKEHKERVQSYQKEVASKSDLERTELSKTKTGAFTGSYAINPVNQKKIPIWVADYVLMGYGTGAVMAVPGHDQRDFEFAKKFELPIELVVDSNEELTQKISKMSKDEFQDLIHSMDECFSGDGKIVHSKSSELDLDGIYYKDAKEKIHNYFEEKGCGSKCINYKLRDWLFSRQRYWGEPFPILHFEDGSKRVLELDELPLIPPEVTDYKPSGDGKSPLSKEKKWVEITDPKTGKKALRETNTMPQWAGSCWYYLRFCDPKNQKKAWGEEAEKYWMSVDMYVGGVEHAVLHLLYARFWHKVLFDLDLVSTKEPFQTLRNQGLVTAPSYKKKSGEYVSPEKVVEKEGKYFHKESDEELITLVEKMSKSKLNGVTPDQTVEEYGADTLRLYEMFMGPFDKEKLWNTKAVTGCYRFLTRFYDLVHSDKVSAAESLEGIKLAHRLVDGVAKDIEAMQFNTAIAKFMEFINAFSSLETYPKQALIMATHALSSLAPHIAEECNEYLGVKESLTYLPFPKADSKYLTDSNAIYIVQFNGKMRGRIENKKDLSKEDILSLIKQDEKFNKYFSGVVANVIFVPNKLINIVVK